MKARFAIKTTIGGLSGSFLFFNGISSSSELKLSDISLRNRKSQFSAIRNNYYDNLKTLFVQRSIVLRQSFVALSDGDENFIPLNKYISTGSGLLYYDVKEGGGEVPRPGQIVRVHYTGWLDGINGVKKFDSSYDRNQPLSFKAGAKQVIAGWDEGVLTNLKVGGKRYLVIPPELGYGSRGAGGVIPPGATLYFTVELVGIGNASSSWWPF